MAQAVKVRLDAIERSKRPAYLFVEWEEEKQHSVIDSKRVKGSSFKSGERVLCKLQDGEYYATILGAGTRTECYQMQAEMEKVAEGSSDSGTTDSEEETREEKKEGGDKNGEKEAAMKSGQQGSRGDSSMGEGGYGTPTDKEERRDTESKEDKNGEKEAATENEQQGSRNKSTDSNTGEKKDGADKRKKRETESKARKRNKTSTIKGKNKQLSRKASREAAISEMSSSLLQEIYDEQQKETDEYKSQPHPTSKDSSSKEWSNKEIPGDLIPISYSSPKTASDCEMDTGKSDTEVRTEDDTREDPSKKDTYLTYSPSPFPRQPLPQHQPTHFYPPFYCDFTPPPPKRCRSDEESLSGSQYSDAGIMGLRDLVLNSNAQMQAAIANLNASVQSMTSEFNTLKEHIKPILRKRKSEEHKDRDRERRGDRDRERDREQRGETSKEYAILGDPVGGPRQKVEVREVRQSDIKAVERRNSESPEKLALGLLLLLFSTEELSQGNCTKPVRKDILQLDSERLWGIKCHIDYLFPTGEPEARWSGILTKTLNPKCRQLRNKEKSTFNV